EMKQYIDLAKKLGTPYIRVLGDGVTAPHADIDAALVRELCIEAGAYAADSGVTLLLETNGYFADTIRLRQLLREIGMPSVQALWDVHHPYRFLDEPPEQTLENLGDHIRHVHLKDSLFQDGKVRYRMLGQGDIPARRCVELLDAAGYDGFYSLEWVRRWDLSLEEPGIAFAHFAAAFGR
ncbi:MAG: sugar phosphate isomerase/epimerase family protein, partial [Christensenellales bacterium]